MSGNYAFTALDLDLRFMFGLLTAILLACGACWLACSAVYLIGARALIAWRRRRAQVAIRAEVARGLTEIDKFVQAHATGKTSSERPTCEEP